MRVAGRHSPARRGGWVRGMSPSFGTRPATLDVMDSRQRPDLTGRPGALGATDSESQRVGQNSDTGSGDGLDQAGRELNRLARVSLVASAIEQHRAELTELLSLAATDPGRQAAA